MQARKESLIPPLLLTSFSKSHYLNSRLRLNFETRRTDMCSEKTQRRV